MKEAKSIGIKVDKKDWTISAKDFIANIELFSYSRNRIKENREQKTLPPTTYIKNSGFGAKTKLKV